MYRISNGYRIGIVIIILGAVVLMGAIFAAHIQRKRAQKLLQIFSEIEVGSTDRNRVFQLTEPLHDSRTTAIYGDLEQLQFSFNNKWLHLLRLAPYTEFTAYVVMRNGVVVRKHAMAAVEAQHMYGAKVDEVTRPEAASTRHRSHVVFIQPLESTDKALKIIIDDDNTLPEVGRRADWNFNLQCLARMGGCQDARMLLPDAGFATKN